MTIFNRRMFRYGIRFVAALIAFAGLAATAAVAGDGFRLDSGDAIEISIAGVPDLRHRATINLNGEISLPLVGELKVAGMTLPQVREIIREKLPSKIFQQRLPDGRQMDVVVTPEEIVVNVAEYRPVYVNGDVARPGEQPFRPGMTARQAIAVAGGLDVMRYRSTNPFVESANFRAEYETLWAEFAREQAVVRRLEAELAGRRELDPGDVLRMPIPSKTASQIAALEAQQLETRNADFEKEKAYLAEAVAQSERRLAVLNEQQAKEEEGMKADSEDFARVRALYERGNAAIMRVTDARRAMLLSATRQLQTEAQATQIEMQRGDFGRRLERLADQRRTELLRDIQAGNVRIAGIQARLQAAQEKLLYTSLVKSALTNGGRDTPKVLIYRTAEAGRTRLEADEDTALMPGDVVEIVLSIATVHGLAAQ